MLQLLSVPRIPRLIGTLFKKHPDYADISYKMIIADNNSIDEARSY